MVGVKDVLIFFLGLVVNVVSAWLFSLEKISIMVFIFILTGSLIVIIIIGIQLVKQEIGEVDDKLKKQGLEQMRLNERLKIYDRLARIESEVFENGN